ncbi:MAG TPA: hypothetical protein VMY43_08775 [Methanothrix sp.]|nr:hypothetical protein [Methanothrix sp.]
MAINNTLLTSPLPIWWNNDPYLGLLFFLLGVSGAAIIVYIYIGNFEKIIGQSVTCLEIEKDIEKKKNEIEVLRKEFKHHDCRIGLEEIVYKKEDRLYKEKNLTRLEGIILYLFIGGIVSSILAKGVFEAVFIGAAWTSFLGVFGLKKDAEGRKTLKDEELNVSENDYNTLVKDYRSVINELTEANGRIKIASETINKYERETLAKNESLKEYEEALDQEYYNGYGEGLWDIAEAQGISVDDLIDLISKYKKEKGGEEDDR